VSEQSWVDVKRAARMASVDALAPCLRDLVHEYGLHVVQAFLECGVKKPNHIRHLVEVVLNSLSTTRGSHAAQGLRIAKGWRREE